MFCCRDWPLTCCEFNCARSSCTSRWRSLFSRREVETCFSSDDMYSMALYMSERIFNTE